MDLTQRGIEHAERLPVGTESHDEAIRICPRIQVPLLVDRKADDVSLARVEKQRAFRCCIRGAHAIDLSSLSGAHRETSVNHHGQRPDIFFLRLKIDLDFSGGVDSIDFAVGRRRGEYLTAASERKGSHIELGQVGKYRTRSRLRHLVDPPVASGPEKHTAARIDNARPDVGLFGFVYLGEPGCECDRSVRVD